jgi:antitoxin component of RelBE/YafQ-DinJ toxin-antitoxin module
MTTVSLIVKVPEALRRQAQAVAKLRGETVSEVVRIALREYIQEAIEDARDSRELKPLDASTDAAPEPLYDHDEVWAEIEALSDSTAGS